MSALRPGRPDESGLADIAARQEGVVERSQLGELGFGRNAIRIRVRSGRLHPLFQHTFAVGHRAIKIGGWWWAAVLSCGPGAALSHQSAAARWGMRRSERIEVTVPNDRRRDGICIHRSVLPFDEVTEHDGIPITTVPRTILDLAAILPRHRLEAVINEAEHMQLRDDLSLADLVERYPGRRGTSTLRAVLEDHMLGERRTRSELEERFLALLASADLPLPQTNQAITLGARTFIVDCLWREARVIVELDGRKTHLTRSRFESDRERDELLSAAGLKVIRVTWRRIDLTPGELIRSLRRLLDAV
jgi:very-short-patch-repair endonuclease